MIVVSSLAIISNLAINDFLYFIDNAIGVDADLLSEVFLSTDLDAVEIIDTDSVEPCASAEFGEYFRNSAAEAADDIVFFDCKDMVESLGTVFDDLCIDRLHCRKAVLLYADSLLF